MQELPEPAAEPSAEERRTTPVELLWDLVYVFAITQVTTLLSRDPSWTRFGESMLVLALVWWAWSAFVWVTNAQSMSRTGVRLSLLLATVVIFVAGLAIPSAFGPESTLFAATYAVVRVLHLALYIDATRQGAASRSAIAGFSVTSAIGMALLIGGSFLHGTVRAALWTAAVVIDYSGPLLTRQRLRSLQRVVVSHFAERYSLFVIICLGESLVAIGVGATGHRLDAALIAAVSLGLLITVALWWTYFDQFAAVAEAILRRHRDPVLAASDAYSYIHFFLVAGIIVFAVGSRFVVRAAEQPLHDAARLALCGGVALYLAGQLAFRWRLTGKIEPWALAVALAVMILFAVGASFPAWTVAGAITALLAILCVSEVTARSEERHVS